MTAFFNQYDHLQNQPRSLIIMNGDGKKLCRGCFSGNFPKIFLKFSEQFLYGAPTR